ncbi:cytochrome c [Luteolibacter yonseiensis]|uniref:Cytochrome c n=1 Tax=Luteolibacter yonseiensis TaxID=1144680 RepID=A0A934R4P5_9BACT|nr:cytochrome c [Luteolibacter yonseiensis]MBK1815215.1 cytochrome c [Luteolibacter yonseiensis]
MDPSRDNPIVRFTTFWWGIGTFFIFAALLAVIWLFARSEPETLEDAAAKPRYATKAKIDAAQAAALPDAAIEAAVPVVAQKLAASKPVAVEVPGQIVPGSETAKKLADAPKVDTSAIDKATAAADTPIDPAQMEAGKAEYMICGACHGQNGEGTPAGPPLAGSEWVTGPVSNLVLIQMRGLTGPITVAGKEYTFPAGMFPLGLGDKQIADVLTYIRNSFGNKASAVTVEQVTPLRGEVGKPQLTEAELTKP